MPFQNTFGGTEPCICGLVFYMSDLKISSSDDVVPVPLKNVNISTKIIDFVSEVTVTQSYVNVESNPIEAVYMFPIEEEAAVISFEAEVDDRKIFTQVKEKEKAKNDYEDAMRNKKTAVLLEETQPDIFQIKLGQLKPGAEATITIKYVSELPVEDGKVKLTIPTTIAPRYVSPKQKSDDAKKIASIPYSANTPAPLSINLTGLTQCKIKSLKSPSHEFRTSIGDTPNSNGQYTFTGDLSIKTTDMDRDIILYIEAHLSEELNKPMVFLEKPEDQNSKKGLVGMVSLVPNFELDDQLTELIFLVDRSGSMGGSSMEQAKKALELFLHSLPSDCFFNIWSFGSRYSALFKNASAEYSDKTLNEALQHVRSMRADFGGTDIYEPLQAIFQQVVPKQGYLRQIFVLTDGEVSNAASVISLAKKNSEHGRIFSLGLGASASRYLVKGVARAGGGTAVFANEREDLRAKVMGQLKNGLQPALSNIQISWDGTAPEKGEEGTKKSLLDFMKPKKKEEDALSGQVPSRIPPVFDGSRLLVYYLYHSESDTPKAVKITAESTSGPLVADIDIVEANILQGADFVRKLAARKKIQELQESKTTNEYEYEEDESKDDIKKAITRLGIDNGLASKYTSFVGVDKKSGKTLAEKPMSTREIKNQVPSGFGMSFGGGNFKSQSFARAPRMRAMGDLECAAMPRMAECASFDDYGEDDESSDEEMSSDGVAESAPNPFSRFATNRNQKKTTETKQPEDKMTELIGLQKSNGIFDISSNDWTESVIAFYLGKYEDVQSSCPPGVTISLWITALALKIMEIKMSDKKELWELVAQKSKKSLNMELKKNKEQVQALLVKAEEYIDSK